jgi:ubiquinone/menaquinone biosynthesis C-methylase UbiE
VADGRSIETRAVSSRGFHRFSDVDASEQAAEFVSFLDRTRALPEAMERRAFAYQRLRLRPGQRVLDAGCGPGDDTRELAQLVAPGGEAVGIDLSEALLAEANRRNGTGAATFVHGSVTELPFGDASFDAYRAERLHQHLIAPEAAMAEAARVLRRGGRIAIGDADWGSVLVDSEDPALTRTIVDAFCDSFANGWSGRRLYGQLVDAGFDAHVEVLPVPPASPEVARTVMLPALAGAARAAAVDLEQLDRWLAEQHDRIERSRFFLSFSFILASGTRC